MVKKCAALFQRQGDEKGRDRQKPRDVFLLYQQIHTRCQTVKVNLALPNGLGFSRERALRGQRLGSLGRGILCQTGHTGKGDAATTDGTPPISKGQRYGTCSLCRSGLPGDGKENQEYDKKCCFSDRQS